MLGDLTNPSVEERISPGEFFGAPVMFDGSRHGGVFHFDGTGIRSPGHPKDSPRGYVHLRDGESLRQGLVRSGLANEGCGIQRMKLAPGQFYPGMARPYPSRSSHTPGNYPDLHKQQELVIASLN